MSPGLLIKLPTPNPDEFALQVWVPQEKIVSQHMPTSGTTTYREFKMHPTPNTAEGYAGYIYTYATGPREDGALGFHFAKPKTAAEMRVPFRSQIERMGNHRWPDVLVALAVTADYTFPRAGQIIKNGALGTVTGPNYRISEALIPEMNEGTRFLVQEFQSPTPFTIPRYRVPGATSVSLSLPDGTNYRHGECLHDDIEIDALNTASATYLAGSASSVGGNIESQRFPASNFSKWRAYWFSDEQVLKDGGWYRRRVRVLPPRAPRIQLSQN